MSLYVLACIDCEYPSVLWRREPRIPLCRPCKEKRDEKKGSRGRTRPNRRTHTNYRRPKLGGEPQVP